MEKRVCFSKENQIRLIQDIQDSLNLNIPELSRILKLKEGSLKSYKYGSCNIPYNLFLDLIKLINKSEDEILKQYNCKITNQKIIIGRKILGEEKKVLGDINLVFKNLYLKLDISKVNFSKSDVDKQIRLPNKITPALAEEIGMNFGDGFLSASRYDYRLKGNPYDEKEYYVYYIKPLFKELFNIDIVLKESYNSYGFELYSKAFWDFKTNILGIKPGNKEKIFIPEILKVNDLKIICAFIRGLFDTDGCLNFKSKYGYINYYPSIELTLVSKRLIGELKEILDMLGFNPSVSYNERYGKISIYGIKALKRYEELIGWSNQKNLNKLNNWKNRYPELYFKDMAIVAQWKSTRLWSVGQEFDSPLSLLILENKNQNLKKGGAR